MTGGVVKGSLTGLDTRYAFTVLSVEQWRRLGHEIQALRRRTLSVCRSYRGRAANTDPRVDFPIACVSFNAAESQGRIAQ